MICLIFSEILTERHLPSGKICVRMGESPGTARRDPAPDLNTGKSRSIACMIPAPLPRAVKMTALRPE
jgi:hypothetical protein